MARKNILSHLIWLLPALIILVLLGFTDKQQKLLALQKIEIDLKGHAAAFITKNEILKIIGDQQHILPVCRSRISTLTCVKN